MEAKVAIGITTVVTLVAVAPVGIIYLVSGLTKPGRNALKFFGEFVVIAFVLGIFLPGFISIPGAFAASFIHRKARRDSQRTVEPESARLVESQAGPASEEGKQST